MSNKERKIKYMDFVRMIHNERPNNPTFISTKRIVDDVFKNIAFYTNQDYSIRIPKFGIFKFKPEYKHTYINIKTKKKETTTVNKRLVFKSVKKLF